MGYHVKIQELMDVQNQALAKIGEWSSQLDGISHALQTIADSTAIQGKTAESIKSYLAEVHVPLVLSLQQMLNEYQMRLSLYADGYYQVDGSYQAEIPEDTLEEQQQLLQTDRDGFQTLNDAIHSTLDSINDIVSIRRPSGTTVRQAYLDLKNQAKELDETVGEYEETHQSDTETVADIMDSVREIVSAGSGDPEISVLTYQSGSIGGLPAFQQLATSLSASSDFVAGNLDQYEAAIEHFGDRMEDKAADDRKEDAFLQILGGAASVLAGAVLIVATAGMATPIVVGAFAVGGTSMLYGLSNTYEGIDNARLGFAGDGYTVASNPIRDDFFSGNPDLYYAIGNTSTMISAVAVPVGGAAGAAVQAGTSPIRAMSVEGGKLILSGAAGQGTSELISHNGGSRIEATLAGLGVGIAGYGGLTKVDSAVNLSGLHPGPVIASTGKDHTATAPDAGTGTAEDVVEVTLSRSKYPESVQHIEDAIRDGQPDTLTIARGGAKNNRKASLKGIDKVPGSDLDEYPPAMFAEGGSGASVRPIPPSDNRGSGSTMGHQLRDYPDGTKVKIIVKEGNG